MQIPNLNDIVQSEPFVFSVTPDGWSQLLIANNHQSYYKHRSGILVVASIDTLTDGSVWMHISSSKNQRNPSWEDMYGIKRVFFGDEVEAIQVFPKKADLVDIANCLHLWSKV